MKRGEQAHLRQGVVLPETPVERQERSALEEDLRSAPLQGRPLSLRLRNFRPTAEAYLASGRGPRPYMLRLHSIEELVADHEAALAALWHALAEASDGDARRFSRRWRASARGWSFDEVNDLIDRHNRWYPIESRLPMDPRSGTYVFVNGRDYRLAELDTAWVLDRFPPRLEQERKALADARGARADERIDRGAIRVRDVTEH